MKLWGPLRGELQLKFLNWNLVRRLGRALGSSEGGTPVAGLNVGDRTDDGGKRSLALLNPVLSHSIPRVDLHDQPLSSRKLEKQCENKDLWKPSQRKTVS